MPIAINASFVVASWRKKRTKQTAPIFPPALTIPAMEPVHDGLTYGTIPNVDPSAACTNMEKITRTNMDAPRLFVAWVNMMIRISSVTKQNVCHKIRPLMPIIFLKSKQNKIKQVGGMEFEYPGISYDHNIVTIIFQIVIQN